MQLWSWRHASVRPDISFTSSSTSSSCALHACTVLGSHDSRASRIFPCAHARYGGGGGCLSPAPAPLPNAHAHEENYGWLARSRLDVLDYIWGACVEIQPSTSESSFYLGDHHEIPSDPTSGACFSYCYIIAKKEVLSGLTAVKLQQCHVLSL